MGSMWRAVRWTRHLFGSILFVRFIPVLVFGLCEIVLRVV
jgi:hypothetical protein